MNNFLAKRNNTEQVNTAFDIKEKIDNLEFGIVLRDGLAKLRMYGVRMSHKEAEEPEFIINLNSEFIKFSKNSSVEHINEILKLAFDDPYIKKTDRFTFNDLYQSFICFYRMNPGHKQLPKQTTGEPVLFADWKKRNPGKRGHPKSNLERTWEGGAEDERKI